MRPHFTQEKNWDPGSLKEAASPGEEWVEAASTGEEWVVAAEAEPGRGGGDSKGLPGSRTRVGSRERWRRAAWAAVWGDC